MEPLSRHQIADAYFISTLSLFGVFVFVIVYAMREAPWLKKWRWWCLMAAWAILELSSLAVFAVQTREKTKISWLPMRSMYGIFVTSSLWGISILQVTAVIYQLGSRTPLNKFAGCTAIAGCIEVLIIIILMLTIPQVTAYIEIVCVITPFTSQTITIMMMIHHTFRSMPGKTTPRPRVLGSIWVSLAMIVISIVAVVLSVTGLYQSAPMIHGILYAREPITALLSAKQAKPSLPPPDAHPEIPLALDALPNSTSSLTHGTSRPTSSGTRPAPHYSPC